MRERSPLSACFAEALGLPRQIFCSVYMKLVALFAKTAMGHVTLLSCTCHWLLSIR